MKKIIERIIPEDVNLFETIVKYMLEDECWIYISKELSKRLKKEYPNVPYACINPNGTMYHIRNTGKRLVIGVDEGACWDMVSYLNGYLKEDSECKDAPKVARDPECIVFLS